MSRILYRGGKVIAKRTVTAYGVGGTMLAQYPATMGGEHDPLPIGHWTISSVQRDPWFYYDPVHFWNASPNEAAAKLPPGPRNPAGVRNEAQRRIPREIRRRATNA